MHRCRAAREQSNAEQNIAEQSRNRMRRPDTCPRHGSGRGSAGRANKGRHAHLHHIARGRHDCRGTAATELHLCIGERQGARGV
jgi:hypothetical protein